MQRDVILAVSAARNLQAAGHQELAAEAFRSFAEALADSQDSQIRRLVEEWQSPKKGMSGFLD